MAGGKVTAAVGAMAANLHEAARSEYLAQFVFSAFGSSAPVARTEDYGVDLHCTLTRRDGRRLWPDGYYAVQVKSVSGAGPGPWIFSTPESVAWFAEHPAPLLLCTVEKKAARIRVYQNLVRFGVALTGSLPAQLTLVPGGRGSGANGPYGEDLATGHYLLGDPVLDFTIPEILDEARLGELKRVLKYWVDLDAENIERHRIGLRTLRAPWLYATNEVPTRMMEVRMRSTPSPVRARQEQLLGELALGAIGSRLDEGDRVGALLAALLVRHRQSGQQVSWGEVAALRAGTRLNAATGTDPADSDSAPLDHLLRLLGEMVGDQAATTTG